MWTILTLNSRRALMLIILIYSLFNFLDQGSVHFNHGDQILKILFFLNHMVIGTTAQRRHGHDGMPTQFHLPKQATV